MIIFGACWLSLSSLVDWYLTDQHSHYTIPLRVHFFPLSHPPLVSDIVVSGVKRNPVQLFSDPDGTALPVFIVTTAWNLPDLSHLDALTGLTHVSGSVCCRWMMPVFSWLGTRFRFFFLCFFLQINWNLSDLIIWHLFHHALTCYDQKLSLDGTTRY